MDSPLSPIIADMIMQDLEKIIIMKLQIYPLFYCRYVDDIIPALLSDKINDTFNTFNSLHTRLQFTMEVGIDNKLNFLNTTLIIDSQRIIFDTYHKVTFSRRLLNFNFNHSLCHKRGTIISFVDKIVQLSHSRFLGQYNNLIQTSHIFLNNAYYSLFFIFSMYNRKTIKISHT